MSTKAHTGARAACALALLALTAAPAGATASQAWVLRNRADFRDAKLDAVALGGDGTLRLSAKVTRLLDAAQPNMWCLARDAGGRLYAGGGNEGKVYRIDPATGRSEEVFDADELEVHAVAVDARGSLYAGTSPRGAVYRVEEGGLRTLIFDPEETYIWALAFDDRGRLLVATGQRGRVYRIDTPGPNAKGRVVLDGREDHIRTLARGPNGSFFAGSDQNGILYRIPPEGEASVVYDSPMREVAALAISDDAIYMAALAPMPRARGAAGGGGGGGVTRVRVTADETGAEQEPGPGAGEEEQDRSQRQREQGRPPQESYYGAVYRVSTDGYAKKLWESREMLPLSLAAWGDHAVLVGTGNDGRVLVVDDAGEVTDFVEVPSQQVNALLPDLLDAGGMFAAASNLGEVVRISPGAADRGTVTSRAYDAGYTSSWGALSWIAELPKGSAVAFRVRTGNTEEPDDSWSDWSAEYADPDASAIDRPKARYLQWQAVLKGARGGGPVLRSVQIHYLQDNLPPEVTAIEVMPPGVTLNGSGGSSGEQPELGPAARRAQSQPRRAFERGRRSVSWKVEDANNDTLRYDVLFKAEDETRWKPMARNIEDEFYTWDAAGMPDGVYRIRVTATDAPSNPPGSALTGLRDSLAFDVDNTPPVVGPLQARLQSRSAEVTATVTDGSGVLGDSAWSVDGEEWTPVLPEDRITDSTKETYRFRTGELTPGEHTVTLRARDRAGNAAAGRVVIRVEK